MRFFVDTDRSGTYKYLVSGESPTTRTGDTSKVTENRTMTITSEFTHQKKDLPAGKLNARWIYSRGVYQVYAGSRFLTGVNGDTEEVCIRELGDNYKETRKIEFH